MNKDKSIKGKCIECGCKLIICECWVYCENCDDEMLRKHNCNSPSEIRINKDGSVDGKCSECGCELVNCNCIIYCKTCEDGQIRIHKCNLPSEICESCEEPLEDCNCQKASGFEE